MYDYRYKNWNILLQIEAPNEYALLFIARNNTNSKSPPVSGWQSENGSLASLTCTCYGELVAPIPIQQQSNIQKMMNQPITTLLVILLCSIAYYIWHYRIDQSLLTFSYASVMNSKEYWRFFTASFSHFDLMHLGFNSLGLYQFGNMEDVYGSLRYAYLSLDAVVITMLIFLFIFHGLITKFGRDDLISQQAVGYSCVLFAWMIAASARMPSFCPLGFILPSFCFETYRIPIGNGFPINIGPLLLLIITKFIIPRSSFTGHLAGVILGFPLAWNLLDWLTPPLLLSFCVAGIIILRQLYFWKLPGYDDTTTPITDLTTQTEQYIYNCYFVSMICLFVISALMCYCNPWSDVIPRLSECFLLYGCWRIRRCLFITDSRPAHDLGTEFIFTSLFFITAIATFDIWSLVAAISSMTFLTYSISNSSIITLSIWAYIFMIITELSVIINLVASVQNDRSAEKYLLILRIDKATLYKDYHKILSYLSVCDCCGMCQRRTFAGSSNRIVETTASAIEMTDNSDGNFYDRDRRGMPYTSSSFHYSAVPIAQPLDESLSPSVNRSRNHPSSSSIVEHKDISVVSV
jgi:membrane associated rhomboid family serine protease